MGRKVRVHVFCRWVRLILCGAVLRLCVHVYAVQVVVAAVVVAPRIWVAAFLAWAAQCLHPLLSLWVPAVVTSPVEATWA